MDILFVLNLLLKHKWYLILIPTFCAALSYLLTEGMPSEYKSVAKLETRFTTEDRISVTTERFNPRDVDVKFNNLVETMSSELMVSMLSYRLMLHDLTDDKPFRAPDPEVKSLITQSWQDEAIPMLKEKLKSFSLLSSFQSSEKKTLEILAGYDYSNETLEEQLKIGRVQGSDFVNVQFISEDPILSAFVVNTLSEESIRYDNYLSAKRSKQTIDFFSNLLEEKKQILDERTNELDAFRKTARTLSYAGEPNSTTTEASLEEKKSSILSNIHRLNLSIESLNRRINHTSTPQRQNEITSNIVNIRKKIDAINAQPDAKSVASQNRINELTDDLQAELSLLDDARAPGKTKSELSLEKEEAEIELRVLQSDLKAMDNLIGTLRKNVTTGSTIEALQRQVDKASEEYLDILDRYNVEKSKALISSPLQLVIHGLPSEKPEFPKRYLIVAAVWVASFMICILIIGFQQITDTRVRTREQLEFKSGLYVAATIGKVNTRNLNLNDLFVLQKRKDLDVFKNHLRKLRYEIEKSGGQVLLVTSTAANQGKTFLTLCISYLLGMLKKKVLIIDTNFRHNSITQVLQRKVKGQTNGEVSTELEMQEKGICVADAYPTAFVRSTMLSRDQLWIEAVGNSGSSLSPAEIFAEKDFKSTLNSLKEHYDYIILEGPALNDYSDTRELANYTDSVVCVFSAESGLHSSDMASIDFLKTLDGKFIGGILNKVKK